MFSWFQLGLMILSAFLIAIADSLIKKTSVSGVSYQVFLHPLMLLSYLLYFIQIVIAYYIFSHGGELSIYTNLFIVFYSVFCVLSGLIVFGEHICLIQQIGIVLALVGAVLININ